MQNPAIKPSTIFPNTSARLFRQFEFGGVVEKAHQTFKEKTYLERYKNLYTAANFASFLLQTLSALFAFTFGQHLVASVLPQFGETFVLFTSCLLAALLLVGIEVIKRLCLGSFIVTFIQSRAAQSGSSISWGALAINVLLIGVAVFTSTEGAKEFTRRQTDKSELIQGHYATESAGVAAYIQKQMDSEKQALADFKRSVSWKGKINMAEKNTAFTIASHNRRLEKLQEEKEKALASLEIGLQTDLNDNAAKTTKDSGNMFWVSLLVELSGLLCIGYVFFFLSRVFIENGISGGGKDEQEADDAPTPINPVQTLGNTAAMNGTPTFKNPIGFRQYDNKVSESDSGHVANPIPLSYPATDLPTAQVWEKYHLNSNLIPPSGFTIADLEGFLRKYENVVKGLEEGLSNKKVAKRCKVSETTVHNVKRCLRNLGNAKVSAG
jgi:hypothetical protein